MNRMTERIPIDAVIVKDRLREDYGDIAGLADSIMTHGLLHPLTVDADNNLIAGERRLKAMQRLGYQEVEIRRWGTLTEAERRELELEENLRRKDLTAHERSKNTVELAQAAEHVDRETGEISTESAGKSRGRPPVPGSKERVSERIGIPVSTINDAKKHVAAAEKYTFLQGPDWKQYRAMEVAEALDKLPEDERDDIVAVLEQPGVPADTAVTILNTWEATPAPQRDEIRTQLKSPDTRDVSKAKARLVNEPPPPNRLVMTLEGLTEKHMKEVVRRLKNHVSSYPNDPDIPAIESLIAAQRNVITQAEQIIRQIDEQEQNNVEATA